jgi:hypothetical protein
VGLKSHVRGKELARGGFLEELRKQSHVPCYWCASCEGFLVVVNFLCCFFYRESKKKWQKKVKIIKPIIKSCKRKWMLLLTKLYSGQPY